MKIDGNLRESAIILELASRIKQYRIAYPMTRDELAERSMVSVGTIARFENGKDIGLLNMIKLLAVLGLESNLDMLIPDPQERPSYHVEKSTMRKRAGRKRKLVTDWKWGDEV